ncbi:flagellar hook-associated protein FlgL [Nocardioides sp. R-C-SC26]|uniref:flagellar hook-associated protein FlgL n=1 Tax=Nocardioides sp. R-C-SC26 TaxID=2870414 RepID=UPI001E62F953|nr:flagellar hook-associated protein FlgL [Nocardioides sp. R-C-SC26]
MSGMRVTQGMLASRSLTSLQTSLSRLASVQEQLSTGRVVNRASDSPTDAAAAMRLRTKVSEQEQYSRNVADGLGWLGQVDNALGSLADGVRRARELGLQGASTGSTNQTARDALATEVDQLRQSLIGTANTSYLGRPIFGGVTPGDVAFDSTGAYVGTPGQVMRTVADGVKVRVDVGGTDVMGSNGDSLFDDLTALSAALRAGDATAMRATLSDLSGRLDTISATQTKAGASFNQLEAASQSAQDAVVSLSASLSEIENTDLAKATVELKLQEVAYQAALASTARVMQPSLVDFLR